MNKFLIALLALALFVPAMAFAQSNDHQNDQKEMQQEQNQAAGSNMAGANMQPQHMMTGTVSDHGKKLTSGNVTYPVSNPGTLKNYDNQSVKVKFLFDQNNTIHILKAMPHQ